jgi:hypothetical protein
MVVVGMRLVVVDFVVDVAVVVAAVVDAVVVCVVVGTGVVVDVDPVVVVAAVVVAVVVDLGAVVLVVVAVVVVIVVEAADVVELVVGDVVENVGNRVVEAGEAVGGDKRGKQSAGLKICTADPYPDLDIRSDDHADPLADLRRLHRISLERYAVFRRFLAGRDSPWGESDRSVIEAAIARDGRPIT